MKTRLREARQAARLTQAQLAAHAGVSQRLVSSIESGVRIGSLETLQSLARVLGVKVGWLTGEVAEHLGAVGGAQAVLEDDHSPPGLRQLAEDRDMADALGITDAEWEALRRLDPPGVLSKSAYLAVLYAMRSA